MEVNLNIEKKDIKLIKEFLSGKTSPVDLDEIVYKVALFKTRDTRSHKVKVYNPDCEYKVGDLIFKDYPGQIPIGAKKQIQLERGVVLLVTETRTRFGIDEIKLKYEGTSAFKKYTAYLERQKIDLLLPHKQQKPVAKPEFIDPEDDPRTKNAPMENRALSTLKKKLAGILNKENDLAFISNKALLNTHLKTIEDDVFDKIREFLTENKNSETTEFFVENFAKIKPEDPDFNAYCFSLNYRMSRDYKIDFQQTRFDGWGKWNLISVIYYMKKDSPISDPNPLIYKVTLANKKNLAQRRRKFEEELFEEGAFRYYLTQREITAGAVRLKPGLIDMDDSIEVELVDAKNKKPHLLYFYSDSNILLGFKEIFERYKAPQGSILSFEKTDDGTISFNLRTTKKGTIADRVSYIKEEKAFTVLEEKIASPVFVNKSIFLEMELFKKLYEKLIEFRTIENLNKLVHKVFLEFGIKEKNYEIHILRLYHILDLIYPIDLKMVEDVILSNNEFIPSEKVTGVFYLDSSALGEIEEEDIQRKEVVEGEVKKKREEVKLLKIEEEQRLKDEIKRKREERRKKREDEMWQKEKLKKEQDEKKTEELKQKKDKAAQIRRERAEESRLATAQAGTDAVEPAPRATRAKKAETKSEAPFQKETTTPKETPVKKDKPKKRPEEENKAAKGSRRAERPIDSDNLSEEDLKSEIQLEELKAKLEAQKNNKKKIEKKAEIAYQDNAGTGFGGIFASKLDEIVKKDGDDGTGESE